MGVSSKFHLVDCKLMNLTCRSGEAASNTRCTGCCMGKEAIFPHRTLFSSKFQNTIDIWDNYADIFFIALKDY